MTAFLLLSGFQPFLQAPEVEFLGMNHVGAFLLGSAVEYDVRTPYLDSPRCSKAFVRSFNAFNGPLAFIAVTA